MRRLLLAPLALAACIGARDLVPGTVDDDPSLPRIEVNGTALHVTDLGDPGDPLIVFVHGGPGNDHRHFLVWADLVDAGYRLVMYDQRGAGLSRRHSKGEVSVELALADLQAVIDHHRVGDEPVVLFAHSWGSMLSTGLINREPRQVAGAVLTEPPGFTRDQLEDFFLGTFDRLDLGEGVADILWAQQFLSPEEHAQWDYLFNVSVRDSEGWEGNARDHAAPFWRWGAAVSTYLPGSIGEFDWTTRLGEADYPVLWFNGELNRGTSEAAQRALAASYPAVEFHLVAGAGHDLLYQKHAELRPIVVDYLARVTAREPIP
jgi:proline iminopeptidase